MSGKTYASMSIEQLAEDPDSLRELVRDYTMYKEAFDAIPDPVVIHDDATNFLACNEAHRSLMEAYGLEALGVTTPGNSFEQTRDIVNASPFAEGRGNIGDTWYEMHKTCWAAALESGKMLERQEINGAWLLQSVRQTESGYFVDYRTNINEQKDLQQQLHQILETTTQGVVILDENFKILRVNPAFLTLWGAEGYDWEKEPTIGALLDYCRETGMLGGHCESDEHWQKLRAKALDMSRLEVNEGIYVTFDNGTCLHTQARKLPNGHYLHLYDNVTEIQAQKKALEAEKVKAELAERAKSEFLANMSHEIRTPMNGVMGMAELLIRTELDSKQRSFADTIVKSGAALLTIINDILDFSKIDAGQMTLNPVPFHLADAIEDVATLVSSRAAEKDIELAVRVSHDLPQMIIGDVGRIRQIVTNLVGNAVKFTDEGHVLINVSGDEAETEDGAPAVKLKVRVEDTGIGIPEEKCATIFEKFSQVDGSAVRRHEGTGLGLAITSSLVDLMGGEIGVESEEGKGSTFWVSVTLPVKEGERRKTAPVDVTGARVLIIDDNEINRSILSEQMTAWNLNSKACDTGREGIAMAIAATMLDVPFDLIILDYHMPAMTGSEAAKILRQNEKLKDTPIIMLTSVDEAADGSSFLDLDIQAHLTKPARSSLLLETIVEQLQHSESRKAETREETAQAPQTELLAPLSDVLDTSVDAPAEAAVEQTPEADTKVFTKPSGPTIDILIAEDNEINQIVFSQTLKGATGYSFKIANNGEEAVALYKEFAPKLMLMDVSMPIMNGMEATASIREIETQTGEHVPIIGVTAHAINGDREKCLEAGMDDYLSKPISPDMLLKKIENWMAAQNRKRA